VNLYKTIFIIYIIMDYIPIVLLSLYASGYFSIVYAYYYHKDICKFGIKLYENNIQNYLISCGIRTISAYSSFKNYVSNLKTSIYTYHPYITYTIDLVSYTIHMLDTKIHDYNIEPFQTMWINECSLHKNNRDNETDMKLEYLYYFVDNTSGNKVMNFFKTFNVVSNHISNMVPDNTPNEILLFGKFNDIYVSRVYQPDNNFAITNITDFTKPSNVSFLSVSLIIPHQQPIDIIIDKNMLYINNEILSKAFIERYLDHHNIKVKLSDDYKVDFIDNNIDMSMLKSSEYIILQLHEYTIRKHIANGK
jgi:hypothetical protein